MQFSSKLVEQAVAEVSRLPGIGKKSALRIVLHLLRQPETQTDALSEALHTLRHQLRYCRQCHNMADAEYCTICANPARNNGMICVVEDMKDLMAIENTHQYHGQYHVLGGVISPVQGRSPSDLNMGTLETRVLNTEVTEVILALSAGMEGDTTAFYLAKKLKRPNLKITLLARGLPVGSELEYADEITLGRSLMLRTDFNAD